MSMYLEAFAKIKMKLKKKGPTTAAMVEAFF
jgi:hypothetical protein